MARDLSAQTNIDNTDPANYPNGRIKDDTGSGDGTPIDEAIYGDLHQLLQQILIGTATAENGLPDNTTNGFQLYEALLQTPFTSIVNFHGIFNQDLSSEDFGSGDLLFPGDVWITGGKGYVANFGTFTVRVFNLATGAHISGEEMGSGVLTTTLNGLQIDSGKCYIAEAGGIDLVRVFDVATQAPIPAENMGSGVLSDATGIFIQGGKCYVCDTILNEVKVFNVATGAHIPAEDFGSGIFSRPNSVFVTDTRAYVTDTILNKTLVFQLSNQAHLTAEDYGSSEFGTPFDQFIVGNKAYTIDQLNNKVFVHDIQNGDHLLLETHQVAGGGANGTSVFIDTKNLKSYQTDSTLGEIFVRKQNLKIDHI